MQAAHVGKRLWRRQCIEFAQQRNAVGDRTVGARQACICRSEARRKRRAEVGEQCGEARKAASYLVLQPDRLEGVKPRKGAFGHGVAREHRCKFEIETAVARLRPVMHGDRLVQAEVPLARGVARNALGQENGFGVGPGVSGGLELQPAAGEAAQEQFEHARHLGQRHALPGGIARALEAGEILERGAGRVQALLVVGVQRAQQPSLGAAAAEHGQSLRRLRGELIAELRHVLRRDLGPGEHEFLLGAGQRRDARRNRRGAAPRRQRGAEDVVEFFLELGQGILR